MQQRRKPRVSPNLAKARGRKAGLTYAIQAGKRPADDPELAEINQELAVSSIEAKIDRLSELAEAVVADWPDLTPEQLGRIAAVIRPAVSR